MKFRRPRLLSPPDQITIHQERNLRKSGIGRGKLLQHQVDLQLENDGKVVLDDEFYILERTLVLNGPGTIIQCHFDGSLISGTGPLIRIPYNYKGEN